MSEDEAKAFEGDDGGHISAAPVHQLPCIFGRYRLERRLGVGGMAEVFLATRMGDSGFERRVVVKRILPHLAQKPRFVEMFLREAKLVASLDHPNIVSIYDFGQEAGAYFLAMEYVEGLSLRDIRRRCQQANMQVPIDVVVRAIADSALGLNAVHDQTDDAGQALNLVHRDISPDNIVLSATGVAKLLDFGIAKSDAEESLTQTGELKGKIPYMPPEQISGDSLDGRADLYALGASLYTLVCGRRPIEAKTDLLALSAILKQRPTPPRALRADIPLALELVMLRLLEKKKERRPKNGQEVHDLLLRAVPSALRPNMAAIAAISTMTDDGSALSRTGPPASTLSPFDPLDMPTDGDHRVRAPDGYSSPVDAVRDDVGDNINGDGGDEATATIAQPAPPGLHHLQDHPASTSVVRDEDFAQNVAQAAAQTNAHNIAQSNAGQGENISTAMLVHKMNQGRRQVAVLAGTLAGVLATGAIVVAAVFFIPKNGSSSNDVVPAVATSVDGGAQRLAGDPKGAANDRVRTNPKGTTSTTTTPTASPEANRGASTSPQSDKVTTTRTATSSSRSGRRRKPTLHSLKFEGPKSIRWVVGGKTVGRGTASADLRSKPKSVLAVDDKKRAKISVPVVGGVARYSSVPTGTVSLRVLPFAKVYIGRTFIGETPLAPFALPAGTYEKVRFVGETREESRKIRVKAGVLLKVKVDLTKL